MMAESSPSPPPFASSQHLESKNESDALLSVPEIDDATARHGLAPTSDASALPLPLPLSSRQSKRGWRRRTNVLMLLIALGVVVLLFLVIFLPVFFVVVRKHHGQSALSSGSGSGSGSTGAGGGGGAGKTPKPSSPSGPTTGGDGSLVTLENGTEFTYKNSFGGFWVQDPADPFNNNARPNSWTPPLNTSWTWGVDRIYGVNLGGWLVLEPFITPALYQKYLPNAVDEYTLSQAMQADTTGGGLGQLEDHYETFITEVDIAQIAAAETIERLLLDPIAASSLSSFPRHLPIFRAQPERELHTSQTLLKLTSQSEVSCLLTTSNMSFLYPESPRYDPEASNAEVQEIAPDEFYRDAAVATIRRKASLDLIIRTVRRSYSEAKVVVRARAIDVLECGVEDVSNEVYDTVVSSLALALSECCDYHLALADIGGRPTITDMTLSMVMDAVVFTKIRRPDSTAAESMVNTAMLLATPVQQAGIKSRFECNLQSIVAQVMEREEGVMQRHLELAHSLVDSTTALLQGIQFGSLTGGSERREWGADVHAGAEALRLRLRACQEAVDSRVATRAPSPEHDEEEESDDA